MNQEENSFEGLHFIFCSCITCVKDIKKQLENGVEFLSRNEIIKHRTLLYVNVIARKTGDNKYKFTNDSRRFLDS